MGDAECAELLRWALPELGLRWQGFRGVRGQVCKRIARRTKALGLGSLAAYQSYLEAHSEEWLELERLCRVTISRFYRDRGVWELLAALLDALAARQSTVRAWSLGCGAGEEPYTLSVVFALEIAPRHPGCRLSVLATDVDGYQLDRARRGCFPTGALRELPDRFSSAFEVREGLACIAPEHARSVSFVEADVRRELPDGPFDLVLCRNIVFTYFDELEQQRLLEAIRVRLGPGGVLALGRHEALPTTTDFEELGPARNVFRKLG